MVMTESELKELELLRRLAQWPERICPTHLQHCPTTGLSLTTVEAEYLACMHNALPSLIAAVRERNELREWQREVVHELEEFRRLSAPQSEIYERLTKLIAQVVQDDSDIAQYL